MYGITETTVHVTWRVIRTKDTVDGSASPIGVPIPDLAVHLLDRAGSSFPPGSWGRCTWAARGWRAAISIARG
jgi:non-ribosomal peptide synthetase component F